MEEEWQWIEDVLSGNKQAYAQIINRYKDPLYATSDMVCERFLIKH